MILDSFLNCSKFNLLLLAFFVMSNFTKKQFQCIIVWSSSKTPHFMWKGLRFIFPKKSLNNYGNSFKTNTYNLFQPLFIFVIPIFFAVLPSIHPPTQLFFLSFSPLILTPLWGPYPVSRVIIIFLGQVNPSLFTPP